MAIITPTGAKSWPNRHKTFRQKIDNLFDVANQNTGNGVNDYNATTAAIQQFIKTAAAQNKSIHALGGGWSFTRVAATTGWMVNTKLLNGKFPIRDASIHTGYKGARDQLLFVQCGNSIQELNRHLRDNKKSLKTCGASNGQTIVGAFATGTHGSAIDFGCTPDFVVGMHIIVSADRHIWLERKNYPVASDTLIQRLNATPVRSDELFDAALVSFGSFGFIHGVMIETEPIYLLECYRQRLKYTDMLQHQMNTLDFTGATNLPHGSERPFHFQVVVNQFDMDGGTYSTIMYKRPYRDNYSPPAVDDPGKAGPGDDVPAFLGKVTDVLTVVTPLIVNKLVKQSYTLYNNVEGTCGEIFRNNDIRGKVISTAMGIPVAFATQLNDMLIKLNKTKGPFTGVFSYRYSKKTSAMLGFTKYDDTLILELDGVESDITRRFFEVVWKEMDRANIPYTFHWGKINNLDRDKVKKMYGNERDRWIKARNEILPPQSMPMFSNQTLKDWGLDEIL